MKRLFSAMAVGLTAVLAAGCAAEDNAPGYVSEKSSKKKTTQDPENEGETKKSGGLFDIDPDEEPGDDNEGGEPPERQTKAKTWDEEHLMDDINYLLTGEKSDREETYITFGRYEQDNDTSNGAEPIEWQVLSVKDGKALIISRYVLDIKPYNDEQAAVYWESCSLRKWVNDQFFPEAFSEGEQNIILTTNNKNEDPQKLKTYNNTDDKVFLLSVAEVEQYATYEREYLAEKSVALMTTPTEYAKQIALAAGQKKVAELGRGNAEDFAGFSEEGNITFWLRDANYTYGAACYLNRYGYFGWDHEGQQVCEDSNDEMFGFRPAMWIRIE